MTYAEKLADPRWQRKRLEILQRDDFKCLYCDSKHKTLHVHHVYYVAGRKPWEYPDFCYLTLCEDCHDAVRSEADQWAEWELLLTQLGHDGATKECWRVYDEQCRTECDVAHGIAAPVE